jgi:hypothetical protein
MSALRRQLVSAAAIARADLLERLRRYSYLWTLAATLYFGYMVNAGQVRLRLGGVRGIMNSAWVGTQIALSVGCFLSLLGFYLVKNTLDRDRRTGVGEILAATPLSRMAYTAGKALSNFLLLASIVAVLAVAGVISQLLSHEEMHVDILALLAPLFFLALPPLAITAALAVLFETSRWLRGSLGNVVFFFLWSAGLAFSGMAAGGHADPMGFKAFEHSFARQLPASAHDHELSLNMGPVDADDERHGSIRWDGIAWTPAVMARRTLWIGLAAVLALLAALPFSRFDPEREASRRQSRRAGRSGAVVHRAHADAEGMAESPTPESPASARSPETRPTVRIPWTPSSRLLVLALAEMQLILRGRNRWWLAGAAALIVVGLAVPAGEPRAVLLMLAWIWPLPLWSELGARETLYGTRPLILAAPLPPLLQCVAIWGAGACVTALAGSGVALRLGMAGDVRGLLGWLAGCLFVPALAIALGTLSGSVRLFEIVYLLLWYAGPVNHVAALDYTGLGAGTRRLTGLPGLPAAGISWIYVSLAAGLFAVAWAARARQTRS